MRAGHAEEGRAEFAEALSLSPGYTDARMQVGNLLASSGENEQGPGDHSGGHKPPPSIVHSPAAE